MSIVDCGRRRGSSPLTIAARAPGGGSRWLRQRGRRQRLSQSPEQSEETSERAEDSVQKREEAAELWKNRELLSEVESKKKERSRRSHGEAARNSRQR